MIEVDWPSCYTRPTDPRWVYTFRDRAGVVLYVGCTADLPRRLRDHARDKAWFGEIARIESSVWPDEASGLAEETRLIDALVPIYERSPRNRSSDRTRRLPCARCRVASHHECLTVNRAGEPCECSVCTRRPLRMGHSA